MRAEQAFEKAFSDLLSSYASIAAKCAGFYRETHAYEQRQHGTTRTVFLEDVKVKREIERVQKLQSRFDDLPYPLIEQELKALEAMGDSTYAADYSLKSYRDALKPVIINPRKRDLDHMKTRARNAEAFADELEKDRAERRRWDSLGSSAPSEEPAKRHVEPETPENKAARVRAHEQEANRLRALTDSYVPESKAEKDAREAKAALKEIQQERLDREKAERNRPKKAEPSPARRRDNDDDPSPSR